VAVDDALRASLDEEVGVEHVELLGEISATLTRRYAAAVGERDPLYHDAQYARSLGYANVVAPLNFLPGVICWSEGAPYDRLREDGTEADKEEERRLMYVALTRAQKKVFLSYASYRTIFGSKSGTIPSQFLSDIPQELLEWEAPERRGRTIYLD